MCTYCTTTNYRKIYENHIGLIPRELNGRTYEIHHIDGNHNNNKPNNLTAVTIQEHYNIHYSQGDWGACILLGEKMKLSPEEISQLARKNQLERVENGTHHFLGSNHNRKRVENGTHHFLGGNIQRKSNQERINAGTHHFLGENNPSHKLVEAGTHHLLRDKNGNSLSKTRVNDGTHHWLGGDIQRKNAQTRVEKGTHNFFDKEVQQKNIKKRIEEGTHNFFNGNHPAKIRVCCIFCQSETSLTSLPRRHSKEKCTPN